MPAAEILRFATMLRASDRVLFVTGAGVSAESGLPTYRGIGGLYDVDPTHDGVPIEAALSGPMLQRDPALVWTYIHQIERACRGALPNPAHRVIAELEGTVPTLRVLTQNVDGLHSRAGSTDPIEIHGNLHRLHCTASDCEWAEQVENYAALDALPRCPQCRAVVRPAVVLFEEMLPPDALAELDRELQRGFDLVVSVGTTSSFPYIAAPVLIARQRGANTVEINPGRSEVSDAVSLRIEARAGPTLQALWDVVG